jgi:hypothetical protein
MVEVVIKSAKPDASSFYRCVYALLKANPPSLQQFATFAKINKQDKLTPTEDAFVRGLRGVVAGAIDFDKLEQQLKSNAFRRSSPEWLREVAKKGKLADHVPKMVKKKSSEVSNIEIDTVSMLVASCFLKSNGPKSLVVLDASNVRNTNSHRDAFVVVRNNSGSYSYMMNKPKASDTASFKPDSKIELDVSSWKLPNRFSFQGFIDDTFRYKITAKSSLFPSQRFVKDFIRSDSPYRGLLLYHGLGAGKCHARDTPILMFDGSIKSVQDIRVEDLVMGDDSRPRAVLSLTRGWDHMYDVIQEDSETYTVNSAHVLCLMHPSRGVIEVECDDYVIMSPHEKTELCGYSTVVEFPKRPLATTPCDPYMLGFWLADAGPSRILGFTRLPFVVKHLKRVLVGSNKTALRTLMLSGKQIPKSYMRNTIAIRQKLLSGMIDADGCVNKQGLFITLDSRVFAEDVLFVARSIGFHAKLMRGPARKRGWLLRLYGPNMYSLKSKFSQTHEPTSLVKNVSRKIKIIYSGFYEYYGFAVDCNHRYILGDMTVTHNSCAAIVAAENMIGTMKVEVLLAASLQRNFIDEIKNRCGNVFFSVNKHWKFLSLLDIRARVNTAKLDDALKFASDITMVDRAVIKKNKGVWMADSNRTTSNFSTLTDTQKDAISKQLTSIIKNKYNFINYNGLTQEAVKSMAKMPENPFDNKAVIVDEVHNFISRVLGSGKTGMPLYNLLLNAKNCKLILLSGTPLINHPYELSYIVNLVRGPQVVHTFEFKSKDALKAAESYMNAHDHVDNFDINLTDMKITAQMVPDGFVFQNKSAFMVSKDLSNTPAREIVDKICGELDCKYVGYSDSLVMPIDKEQFIKLFVNEENASIKSDFQLARRLIGTISHYATVGDNFPSLEPTTFVYVDMSEHQFTKYEEVRLAEIRKESAKKKGGNQGIFADVPSTYRAYSRMCCNFVFPKGINRPYKGSKKVSFLEDDDSDPTYVKAMRALEDNYQEHLKHENIANLSPKTAAMLTIIQGKHKNTNNGSNSNNSGSNSNNSGSNSNNSGSNSNNSGSNSNNSGSNKTKTTKNITKGGGTKNTSAKDFDAIGKCLIYSEYLVAEGLGHVALALRANGWAELRLKKIDGSWSLDVEAEDLSKPKFFQFKTDDEEVEVLKSLYNNDLDRVPKTILSALGGKTNLRGEMLKAILITKSGAEGISLKHVRHVHILDPYWHEVRINQIIGRAVRANSHADLPLNERRVNVFRYMCKFTEAQINGSKTLRKVDKMLTTDQHVYNVAFKKNNVIQSVQRVMMAAAVDCRFHSNHHPDIECIIFPNTDELAFNLDINKDEIILPKKKTTKVEARFRNCMINGVHYAYDGSTNTLYDMEAYMNGKLVRMGRLVKDAERPNYWRIEA